MGTMKGCRVLWLVSVIVYYVYLSEILSHFLLPGWLLYLWFMLAPALRHNFLLYTIVPIIIHVYWKYQFCTTYVYCLFFDELYAYCLGHKIKLHFNTNTQTDKLTSKTANRFWILIYFLRFILFVLFLFKKSNFLKKYYLLYCLPFKII